MIRKSFFMLGAALMLAPDNGNPGGGVGGAEVTSTDNAHAPVSDPVETPDPIKPPDQPHANSAAALSADPSLNSHAHNPYKQGVALTKMRRVTVTKLAVYERDGKHIAGHEIEVTTARADELISTGYAKLTDGHDEHDEDADGVARAIATNTPPVV